MSNLGKRQLGPFQKAYKYEFTLQILKFKFDIPLPCSIKFMWKRNSKSIETKSPIDITPGIIDLAINQKLSSISTIIFNTEKKEFLGKQSELIVNMLFGGSPKKLASCQIDMKSILDTRNHKINRAQIFEIPVNYYIKTSIKDNKITFKLSSIFKEEFIPSEKSIGSLNMSGLSIPQDNKYFERKYEIIPSKDNKDTHSVTSYNPNNRYPSATKRERDDSASIRKYDYNYLATMKSNINSGNTNEYDLKSAGMKSNDNKTEMNDGNYTNKQLVEQQNKRSKAEAELVKNKMQIEGLKNKMNQYVIENKKLKEESIRINNQQQYTNKQETNMLQNKLYQANIQLRTVKMNAEMRRAEFEKLENQINRVKSQKNYYQSQFQSKQRRIQELQKNEVNIKIIENAQQENHQLKNQNHQLKFQAQNLRKFIEDLKKQYQQKQNQILNDKYRQSQDANTKIEYLRKQIQKYRSNTSVSQILQKRVQQQQEQLRLKDGEVMSRVQHIGQLEYQLEQYKSRLSRYQSEKAFMQREIMKLKQEINDKKENDRNKQESDATIERLSNQNKELTDEIYNNQKMIQQIQKTLDKEKQDQNEGRSNKLLAQINELQKRVNQLQSQKSASRQKSLKLQSDRRQLQMTISKMKQQSKTVMSSSTMSPEMDKLFRQSLQQEVELKFAHDELNRLKNIQEAYENERWRAEKQSSERRQLEVQFEKIEKELVNKNRALMIEVEKTKMMTDQLNESRYSFELMRQQNEKSKIIIFNGQQQLNQLEHAIHDLEGIRHALQVDNAQLKSQKNMLLANNEKVKQLQSSLATKEKQLQQIDGKCRQIQQIKSSNEAEMAKISHEKKMLEKRIDMIMQQMHGMKKRYEQQKGRSISFTRNEQNNKVRSMETELQKKQRMISKLNKQKLELEEQNVKLNIQAMKNLSELQKYKGNFFVSHSSKAISNSIK